jgi:PadR family transcriptional regulator, regulatory protein PadR
MIGGGGRGRGWRRPFWMHGPHGGPGGPAGPGAPGGHGPPGGGPGSPGRGGAGGPGGRFVEPFLLLLLAEGPSHGYDLMERLNARGFVAAEVDPGYLYRTLRGMEASGVVTSEWDSASRGPIKRTYALTPEGENALHGWASALDEHRRGLERFLGAYRTRFPSAPVTPAMTG